jgi:hypothetical protein
MKIEMTVERRFLGLLRSEILEEQTKVNSELIGLFQQEKVTDHPSMHLEETEEIKNMLIQKAELIWTMQEEIYQKIILLIKFGFRDFCLTDNMFSEQNYKQIIYGGAGIPHLKNMNEKIILAVK